MLHIVFCLQRCRNSCSPKSICSFQHKIHAMLLQMGFLKVRRFQTFGGQSKMKPFKGDSWSSILPLRMPSLLPLSLLPWKANPYYLFFSCLKKSQSRVSARSRINKRFLKWININMLRDWLVIPPKGQLGIPPNDCGRNWVILRIRPTVGSREVLCVDPSQWQDHCLGKVRSSVS